MTWYRPTKNAAAKGINDLISKIVEAGGGTKITPVKAQEQFEEEKSILEEE